MSLVPGTRLGSYEIVAPIGAGGMGEVYRARDTTLNRDVAIKVLPEAFALDADRLARFQREAQVLASLNHPNIAQIYAVEIGPGLISASGHPEMSPGPISTALIMELVEGQDLSELIGSAGRSGSAGPKGPALHMTDGAPDLPLGDARGRQIRRIELSDALAIARQIADALEAAHEQGIIHRDLKPANVKVRADGTVKVLDFGLAKAMDPAGASSDAAMNSPTMTARATQMGMIIGTAAYMSPEQARGRAVDRRADIWAFGVVLYEMLSGRRAFDGEDISITLAGVLKEDVKWDALPADLPASLHRLLRRCLEKDPKKRLGWIGEARHILGDPASAESAAVAQAVSVSAPPPVPFWRLALPWTAAGVLGITALLVWAPWRAAPVVPAPRKFLVSVGADVSFGPSVGGGVALSPDGTTLALVANAPARTVQLFVRRLDQLQATPLAGTENASIPFFSPGSDWIAFFADGKLKKVSVTGGAPITLCDAPNGRGGTWTEDDTIIFTPNASRDITLLRVPAAGGTPTALGKLGQGATTQRWPQVLPGDKAVLYTEHSAGNGFDAANLVVAPLSGGAPKIVVRGGYSGRYVSSGPGSPKRGERGGGHIIYMAQGTLFAVPFDLARLETTGPAVPAVESVSANPGTAGAQLSVSADGTLVYVPGAALSASNEINWTTRDGKTSVLRAAKATWANPKFSPDGQRLAVEISDGKQSDIWLYEWTHDTLTQLTFEASNERNPVWTPDGRRIAFASDRTTAGVLNIYWVNADGTGEPARLTNSPNGQQPTSFHPTGRFLSFYENRPPPTGFDLMVLPLDGDAVRGWTPGKPTVFLSTPATEVLPAFSPDGRFIAYAAAASGGSELYVRLFPGSGGPWRVSAAGGAYPMWSATSRELLFLNARESKVMSAPYTVAGDSFQAGRADVWTPTSYVPVGGAGFAPAALHPDGKRLALLAAQQAETATQQDKVVFISNFAAYLTKIAPGKK